MKLCVWGVKGVKTCGARACGHERAEVKEASVTKVIVREVIGGCVPLSRRRVLTDLLSKDSKKGLKKIYCERRGSMQQRGGATLGLAHEDGDDGNKQNKQQLASTTTAAMTTKKTGWVR